MTILLDGNSLTSEDVYKVAYEFEKVALHSDAIEKVNKCRKYVEKIISEKKNSLWINNRIWKVQQRKDPYRTD